MCFISVIRLPARLFLPEMWRIHNITRVSLPAISLVSDPFSQTALGAPVYLCTSAPWDQPVISTWPWPDFPVINSSYYLPSFDHRHFAGAHHVFLLRPSGSETGLADPCGGRILFFAVLVGRFVRLTLVQQDCHMANKNIGELLAIRPK
jgi:hypothetical protein